MTDSKSIVREILMEFGLPEDTLRDDASLKATLGLDSFEVVTLAVELKKRAGVSIQFAARKDLTLGQLVEEIDSLRPDGKNA